MKKLFKKSLVWGRVFWIPGLIVLVFAILGDDPFDEMTTAQLFLTKAKLGLLGLVIMTIGFLVNYLQNPSAFKDAMHDFWDWS